MAEAVPLPDAADVVLLLAAASAGANERVAARMRDMGMPEVRVHHGYLFQHLLVGPRTVRELAGLLGVTPQAVSKTVGEMEGLGWVSRGVGKHDQRTRQVALTDTGRALVEAGRRARVLVEEELAGELGLATLQEMRRQLSRLAVSTGGWELLSRRSLRPDDHQ